MEFIFKQIEDESYCLINYKGNEKTVNIPAVYWGNPVTVLYYDLFKDHSEITEVIIPEGITDIAGAVFDGCTSLHQIKLPESLHTLWQYAFARSSFRELVIPGNVSYIPPFAFKDCRDLRKVVFEKGIRSITTLAFEGCDNLQEICLYEATQLEGAGLSSNIKVTITR